jgi:uncharacterized protein YidB (DUF937 family)
MGLMDLAGQLLGGASQGGDTRTQLLNGIIGLIQNHPGGLQGLLGQLQESGLAEHVASWVGTGANLPVNAEQVQQALGGDQVATLAQAAGIPPEHASSGIAAVLPDLINQLTPNGQVPEGSGWQQGLGGLLGKLLG